MINTIRRYKRVEFAYTNYRGERETRQVSFQDLQYGSNEYHPEEQWFLHGYCHEREAMRSFALKDIDLASIRPLDQ